MKILVNDIVIHWLPHLLKWEAFAISFCRYREPRRAQKLGYRWPSCMPLPRLLTFLLHIILLPYCFLLKSLLVQDVLSFLFSLRRPCQAKTPGGRLTYSDVLYFDITTCLATTPRTNIKKLRSNHFSPWFFINTHHHASKWRK